MKKHVYNSLLIICLIALTQTVSLGQSMSISSGFGSSHYLDLFAKEHAQADYQFGSSYNLRLNFSGLSHLSFFNNISFRFEKQSGQIRFYSSALFCGTGMPPRGFLTTQENINKYTLSFISYPFEYNLHEYVNIKLGGAFNKTVSFSTEDAREINDTRNLPFPFESQIDNRRYTADIVLEIQFNRLNLGQGISVVPTYHSSFGLVSEFHGDNRTQSFRQQLGLSIMWGMKEK